MTYSADDLGFLEGQDHFIRNPFKPSSGRPDSLTARIAARTRLTGFTGSGMWLSSDVAPVVYGGQVVFRVSGNASSKLYGLRARVGDLYLTPRTLDDTHFEIDLSTENAAKLRDALAPFVAVARRGSRPHRSGPVGAGDRLPPLTDRGETAAIREWARQRGRKIAVRGRIPSAVRKAYQNEVG